MSDLATVQQLAERVSQMGFPSLKMGKVFLDCVCHPDLSALEVGVLEEFFTACFNAREGLRECIGGYTEEDLMQGCREEYGRGYADGVAASYNGHCQLEMDEARTEAYEEGKADGLAEVEGDVSDAYARGYEDGVNAQKAMDPTLRWID